MLKLQLKRDLRKTILRGHPWIYGQALRDVPQFEEPRFCQLLDHKGLPLAWAVYDSKSQLSIRILSTQKKPPGANALKQRLQSALQMRNSLQQNSSTNAFRLVNGEGDLLPGVIVDQYADTWVLQYDGDQMTRFWRSQGLEDWLKELAGDRSVYFKARHDSQFKSDWLQGEQTPLIEVRENDVLFTVDIENGQKTGFFLDQRDNRDYVASQSNGKTVLNLFSYTGGFSMYAGIGGAQKVVSVDIATGAIENCRSNWLLNQLPVENHQGVARDVFEYIDEQEKNSFDLVIVDPPSMAPSEAAKPAAIRQYTSVFAKAFRLVVAGGDLMLSSCSSHISFEDFNDIIEQALSECRGVAQILRVSGQGFDHPYLHSCQEMRYLKFVHVKKVAASHI